MSVADLSILAQTIDSSQYLRRTFFISCRLAGACRCIEGRINIGTCVLRSFRTLNFYVLVWEQTNELNIASPLRDFSATIFSTSSSNESKNQDVSMRKCTRTILRPGYILEHLTWLVSLFGTFRNV